MTAAKNVETVSPPAILLHQLSADSLNHKEIKHVHQCGRMSSHFFLANFAGLDLF